LDKIEAWRVCCIDSPAKHAVSERTGAGANAARQQRLAPKGTSREGGIVPDRIDVDLGLE
jgi:hypothetical protein